MLKSGLVSISFRSLSCEEIIKIAKEANLSAIEWGSDVHVPPTNLKRVQEVSELTKNAGLAVSSYGSYYRLGTHNSDDLSEFENLLTACKVLGAPVMRIWAGTEGSEKVSEEERKELIEEARILARKAKEKNILLSFECHPNTLTDRRESTVSLMENLENENIKMYWQPNDSFDFPYNLDVLQAILPVCTYLHVFNWPTVGVRKPLIEAEKEWLTYLKTANSDKKEHYCLLEFMPDDKPETLKSEAEILNKWLTDVNTGA